MLNLLLRPTSLYLILSLILVLCVFAQALALVFTYFSRGRSNRIWPSVLLELVILLHLLLLVYRHSVYFGAANIGLLPDVTQPLARYLVGAVMALLILINLMAFRTFWPALALLPVIVTLPLVDRTVHPLYLYLFGIALLYWLLRAIHIAVMGFRVMRRSATMYTLKQAVDKLPTAVVLYEENGAIHLINLQMQRLMTVLTGRVRRNGVHFLNLLEEERLQPGCAKSNLEGDLVLQLPDGSSWLFHKSKISLRSKTLLQLTASDISERWMLLDSLQRQNRALEEKSADLKKALENLHTLSRNEEIKKARMRTHDVLGQRLSLLLRAIQDDMVLAEDVLLGLSGNILMALKEENEEVSPEEEVAGIIRTFAPIGVAIRKEGDLPSDPKLAQLMVEIIRESITNAVRHGYATMIQIRTEENEGVYRLALSNNGKIPELPYKEGDGIRSMRRKIEPYQGRLEIDLDPQFTLLITFPGGE